MITLRDYQRAAIDSIKGKWAESKDPTICVLPTGGGKTAVFLSLLHEMLKGTNDRAMIIAHRLELIDQPIKRMIDYYPEWEEKMGMVMGEHNDVNRQIVVATVQTVRSKKRMAEIQAYGPIKYLVVDECFPAGTLVDNKPIETIKIGDVVTSWDEDTKTFAPKKVIGIFKKQSPDELYKINNSVVCTGNHPFFTDRGWVKAENLKTGDYLYVKNDGCNMSRMQFGVCCNRQVENIKSKKQKTCILFKKMHKKSDEKYFIENNGGDKLEICQRENEEKQSNGKRRKCHENEKYIIEDRSQAYYSGWERDGSNQSTNHSFRETWFRLDNGISSNNEDGQKKRLSTVLQGRYCESGTKNSNRSRRKFSFWKEKSQRQEERKHFAIVRVDSISVLKRSNYDEYRLVCPDDYVYNLEVEDFHTYTANGFIVHNCHHSVAQSYLGIFDRLGDVYHVGVTATPIRGDGEGLYKVYKSIAYKETIVDGIKKGYLVPPTFTAIKTGISLKGVKTTAGDFNSKDLSKVFETSNCFDLVVKAYQEHVNGRQAAAYVVSVEGAYQLAEKFCEAGIPAEAADGTTDKQVRANILHRFQAGELKVIVNVGLWTEGLDIPSLSVILNVRPTKSDGLYLQIIGRALRTFPGKTGATILDFAPEDDRNLVMAGDVLGIQPKRKKDAEIGDVVGSFTFGPSGPVYDEGDPNSLTSQILDYLDISPWSWFKDENGWMSLALGHGADSIQRVLLISPPNDEEIFTLYGLARKFSLREDGSAKYEDWKVRRVTESVWDEVEARAHQSANLYGDASLSIKNKKWRKMPPTDAQLKFADRLKIKTNGKSRGQIAAEITHKDAIRILKRNQ